VYEKTEKIMLRKNAENMACAYKRRRRQELNESREDPLAQDIKGFRYHGISRGTGNSEAFETME
jgi:hypothetical protein